MELSELQNMIKSQSFRDGERRLFNKRKSMSEKLTKEELDFVWERLKITGIACKDKVFAILKENTSSPPSELDSLVSELRDKWGFSVPSFILPVPDAIFLLKQIKFALESYAGKQKPLLYGFEKYRIRDKMFSANHDVASNRVIITDSNGHTETLTVEEFRKKYEVVE